MIPWPAPEREISSPVERVAISGGLSTSDALRALADWLDENNRSPIGPITISHNTLATYAVVYITPRGADQAS